VLAIAPQAAHMCMDEDRFGDSEMIRILLMLLLLAALFFVAIQIARAARRADLDWTGITFMIGFVAMAFYLRHVTGMG